MSNDKNAGRTKQNRYRKIILFAAYLLLMFDGPTSRITMVANLKNSYRDITVFSVVVVKYGLNHGESSIV